MNWVRPTLLAIAALSPLGHALGGPAPQTAAASIKDLQDRYCGTADAPHGTLDIAKAIAGVIARAATMPSGQEGVVWFVDRAPAAQDGPQGFFVASAKGYCHVGLWRQADVKQVLAGRYPE
ncbi:MAG: hypothetical protein JO224_00760 [Pelomonas sp.]|nr:hypothetical protein [Roseateles sp.]